MKFIKFFSEKKYEGLGKPVPVKWVIPQWYKDAESTYKTSDSPEEQAGLKKCMPYMDSLVSGYVLTTPFDIYVIKKEDGTIDFKWNGPSDLSGFIGVRPDELGHTMPRPAGHLDTHLVWAGFWTTKTPKGWSLLFTHPLNRFDLPFTTVSAIMDADEFWGAGNVPFFLKEGFTGTIPAGTPYAQLIPIKRASWKMIQNDTSQKGESEQLGKIARGKDTLYKKSMWHRKDYN